MAYYEPLSEREEDIAAKIVDAAFTVHKKLGPGLLEKIRELSYQRQIDLPVVYDGIVFDEGLRLDVFVEDVVMVAQ